MPNEWTLTLDNLQDGYPEFPTGDWESLCKYLDKVLHTYMANYE